MKKERRDIFIIFFILILINALSWSAFISFAEENYLEVIFFDVGQGDSIFIKAPFRYQILIDGGPDSRILKKLSKEMPFWDRTIDLVILTHPEKDHLTGLREVVKRYKIDNVLWSGGKKNQFFEEWKKLLIQKKIKSHFGKANQKISCGDCQWAIKILYPFEEVIDTDLESNRVSIVSKLFFGSHTFLFTGDISQNEEWLLIEKNQNLKANVLKISHHGSKSASSEIFLTKTLPEIAVISAGKENKYGHPHQEVLDILKKYDIKVFRTDLMGDIKIISDGEKLKVLTSSKSNEISSF